MSDKYFINTDKSKFQNEYFKVMDQRFEAAQAKSLKKGKGELNIEAFLDNEERYCNISEKMKFIYFLFPIITTAWSCFYTFLIVDNNTSNPIIYVCVYLILSILIILWFHKNVKKSVFYRRAWIKAKREKIKAEQEKPTDLGQI